MGDQTPGALEFEVNCPGCGAYFRLKPKKGKLPKGPIPCPKCRTPIPVIAAEEPEAGEPPAQPSGQDAVPDQRPSLNAPSGAGRVSAGVAGESASRDRGKVLSGDDSNLGSNSPVNPFAAMFGEEVGPNSTFLGIQKVPFVEAAKRPEEQPDPPEGQSGVHGIERRGSTTDTSRFLREEMSAERGDQAVAPHLRGASLTGASSLTPQLFEDEEEDELGAMISQARIGGEEMSASAAAAEEAGPFDLRDILEAEKHRAGDQVSQEITRNPALEKDFYPSAEPSKPKENPWSRNSSQTLDDLMDGVDKSKRQSGAVRAVSVAARRDTPKEGVAEVTAPKAPPAAQLARLKLGLKRAKSAEQDDPDSTVNVDRSTLEELSAADAKPSKGEAAANTSGFGLRGVVSGGDAFSEMSAAIQEPEPAPEPPRPAPTPAPKVELTESKRTLPLTPVMPATAVPAAALPEEEQPGAAPSAAEDEPAPKAPPLAALLKRKISPDRLRARASELAEESSVSEESAPSAPPLVERPAEDSPGFESSIAELVKQTERGLDRSEPPAPTPEAPAPRVETPEPEPAPAAPARPLGLLGGLKSSDVASKLASIKRPSLSIKPPALGSAKSEPKEEPSAPVIQEPSAQDLEVGVAPSSSLKTTAPHRPLPSLGTSEQPSLHIPASLSEPPRLDFGRSRQRQPTEPMFPVAPSGLLSIQPPSSSTGAASAGLGAEPSAAGMAGERRGSGYIRLPTAEILEVLGQGTYRLLVEDIVYEPVDEQGLTELIKRGVLLGAEQIAEADGDWMPIGEHPVFRRLRRRMAMEAHALLAKYKKASEERKKQEAAAIAAKTAEEDDGLLDLLADSDGEDHAPPAPSLAPADASMSSDDQDELDLWGDKGDAVKAQSSAPTHQEAEAEAPVDPPATPVDETPSSEADPTPVDAPAEEPQAQQPVEVPEASDTPAEVEPSEPAPVASTPAPTPEATRPERPAAESPADRAARLSAEREAKRLKQEQEQEQEPNPKPKSSTGLGALVGIVLFLILAAAFAFFFVPGVKELVLGSDAGEVAVKPDPEVPRPDEKPTEPPPDVVDKPDEQVVVKDEKHDEPVKTPPVGPTAKDPRARAKALAAQGKHAEAAELLLPQWLNARQDGQLAGELAASLRASGQQRRGRRVLLLALEGGASEADTLERQYKESLADADLKEAEQVRISPGDEYDGALAERAYGRALIELRKGDKPVALFIPDAVDEPGNWRAQLAAMRLCAALGCPVEIPKMRAAFVTDRDLRDLKGAVKERQADTDELDWMAERVEGVEGRPTVLRGVLMPWYPRDAAWSTEAANVWRPWLDPKMDIAELGAPLRDALSGLSRYQGGVWLEPSRSAAKEMTVYELSQALSGLLTLDYLTGNWERYAPPSQGVNAAIVDGKLVALHQGTAFPPRTSSRVKGRLGFFNRYDAAMFAGLKRISAEQINELLFPGASPKEGAGMRVFWDRHDEMVKRINAQIKRYDAEQVLFKAP